MIAASLVRGANLVNSRANYKCFACFFAIAGKKNRDKNDSIKRRGTR